VHIDGVRLALDVHLAVGEEFSVRRCHDPDSITGIHYCVDFTTPAWPEEELNTLHMAQIIPPRAVGLCFPHKVYCDIVRMPTDV
jgi:hypothetical protein